jgi:hypothetical protein
MGVDDAETPKQPPLRKKARAADSLPPIGTPYGARVRARALFEELAGIFGPKEANQILREYGGRPTRAQVREEKAWKVLELYDRMDKPNASKLAHALVTENLAMAKAMVPESQRHGPRAALNVESMRRYIERWIDNRKEGLKDRTWRGPGAPAPRLKLRRRPDWDSGFE